MKKAQSDRLAIQQKAGHGPTTIFHEGARAHNEDIRNVSLLVKTEIEKEFPKLNFRYRGALSKKEINNALRNIDKNLGQTLFVNTALIKPDGGIIEVQDDRGNWRIVLVAEAKYQGKDIENIMTGRLVGVDNNQDFMLAGNAIERAHKNINEIANLMLGELHFPYVLFLEGSNFLTENVEVSRPDGRKVTIFCEDGRLNRLDKLTAANYSMPINTNLCKNRFVKCRGLTIMLQAASIYTQGKGGHWNYEDMKSIMLDVAKTSLEILRKELSY